MGTGHDGTLGEESRRYDPRASPALCYMGTGHDGARGSGTRLSVASPYCAVLAITCII